MQFPLTLFEKIKGFNYSFGLICRYITYKPGVWGPLRTPEAVALLTVKYVFSDFSWYFSSEKLPDIPVNQVWGLLGAPEAVTFLTSKYVSSYYPEHFLLKFQNNFT